MVNKLGIVGAGTMGSGIALAAALKNFQVILCDINEAVLSGARLTIDKNLDFLVNKNKINAGQKEEVFNNIFFTTSPGDCKAGIVIEAVIEKLAVKEELLATLAAINTDDTILASNTSSLSISAIQKNVPNPGRVVGMHFFNPAHVMKLVEVVQGDQTSPEVAQMVMEICVKLDKIPVLCKDAPGFIVNRVARPYYLEAMRLVEDKIAGIEEVDAAMEAAGFKMGPFRLMDMIGMDVNLSVSTSLYDAFGQEERFKPSAMQIEKVKKGELGRKTGKGFYLYPKS
jgi:3-hydroxybutyryl-CoA dehydrogenase